MALESPVTADELFAMPDDGYRYELVYGQLRKMSPAGPRHGWLSAILARRLGNHVEEHDLGVVMTESGFLLAENPDLVRAPDVSFVRKSRVPGDGVPVRYWPGPPDLAIEVVSPSDAYVEVHEKAEHWIEYGCAMVVVVETERKRLVVRTSPAEDRILTEEDVFDAGDVVPGFRLFLGELFDL